MLSKKNHLYFRTRGVYFHKNVIDIGPASDLEISILVDINKELPYTPVLKASSFKSLNWISATTFADLMQFGQGGPELSEENI